MNTHITENNTPAIPAATIARTVVLALALVNQLLSAAGKKPAAHRQRECGAVGDRWPDHRCRHLGMVGE